MSQLHVYDFTLSARFVPDLSDLKAELRTFCKKWVFQKEEGDEKKEDEAHGFIHYQGRLSLTRKVLKQTCIKEMKLRPIMRHARISHTCTKNRNNDFYVTKTETRLEGPWKDTDEVPKFIPRSIAGISLYPFQQAVVNSADIYNFRQIDVIVDESGCVGKTTLAIYCGVHGIGRMIPAVSDYRDIMQAVMNMPTTKLYIYDMPRSASPEKQKELYSALETIKSGYAWDTRYSFKEKFFQPPRIWVFSNAYPDLSNLSQDRWKLWSVNPGDKTLVAKISRKLKIRGKGDFHSVTAKRRKSASPGLIYFPGSFVEDISSEKNIIPQVINSSCLTTNEDGTTTQNAKTPEAGGPKEDGHVHR